MRAVCAVHREANRRRNGAIRAALLELGEAAAAQGFAFAALKGTAWVIEDGDNAAAWRSMLDMDVLVDAKRFDDIPLFLDRLGYVRLSNDARYDINFHHAPYARPDGPQWSRCIAIWAGGTGCWHPGSYLIVRAPSPQVCCCLLRGAAPFTPSSIGRSRTSAFRVQLCR